MAATASSPTDLPPGWSSECHPEVYERPARSDPRKPGQLSDAQIEQFHRDGFLLVENFFSDEELEEVKSDVVKMMDYMANKLFDAGKIKNKHEDADFFKRLILLEKEFPGANIILHKMNTLSPAMRKIASSERLLNLMEDFLGPNLAFAAVWNLRTKTPSSLATTVPWHQDNAYLDNRSYTKLMMTAWIPLLPTDEVNGTLQFVRGAHRQAKMAMHSCCDGPTWYVMLEDEEIEKTLGSNMAEDVVTVNVPFGSFILFNNFIPHRSLMNNSDVTRWSLDLRWQKSSDPDCFWNLKPPAELRRAGEPNFQPDWDAYDGTSRLSPFDQEDFFRTVISGPWMQKWHIVHHNHHTESFSPDPEKWDPRMRG